MSGLKRIYIPNFPHLYVYKKIPAGNFLRGFFLTAATSFIGFLPSTYKYSCYGEKIM